MFTLKIRLVLVVLSAGMGTWKIVNGQYVHGALYFTGSVLLIWGHFRYATVFLAWRAIRRGNTARAKRLLADVHSPTALSAAQRSYFDWASGYLALADTDFARARRYLETVKRERLRTSNERSILACHPAQAAAAMGDRSAAKVELDLARSQTHKPGVDLLIENIENDLSTEA